MRSALAGTGEEEGDKVARIRIDGDSLRDRAAALNGRFSEYEALNARLESLSDSIQSSWSGDAKIAFEKLMSHYITQVKSLEGILQMFRQYAQDTAGRFESADAECAARIRGSF